MGIYKDGCAAILAAGMAAGCAATGDTPFPGAPAAANRTATAGVAGETTTVRDTGTEVGRRVARLREDLLRLQEDVGASTGLLRDLRTRAVENAQNYNSLVGSVQSRLQVGTTPGNPVLTRQWNEAQGLLDQIGTDVGQMTTVASNVAGNSALAAFILDSTRATFSLPGAVDEDHEQLAGLEDEVNRTVVQIDRLLNELNGNIQRQTNFVARERSNLTVLSLAVKNGELFGTSLSNRVFMASVPVAAAAPSLAGTAAERKPLVVIRFDRPEVDYEQPLFTAVSEALDRRPEARFELVAVAQGDGTPSDIALSASRARRSAEQVFRTLSAMGLPADRVAFSEDSSNDARSAEIHVYVR